MRKFYIFVIVLSFSAIALGQTTPKFAWNQASEDLTLSTAQSYTYFITEGTVNTTIVATCSGTVSPFQCTAPVPSALLDNKTHTVTLSVKNAIGSATSSPLSFGPPASPGNVRVIP
jgi:hypothetical protein